MKRNLLSILALGLGFSSMAQIVYTDITDVTLTSAGATTRELFAIDLDDGGTTDFTAFALDTSITSQVGNVATTAVGLDFTGTNEAAGAVSAITGLGDAIKLDAINSATSISSSTTYVGSSSSSSLVFNGGALSVRGVAPILGGSNQGNFTNTTDKYIGVKFMIGTSMPTTHYGWIRVDVADDAATVTIKDFAYQSTADMAIDAGDDGTTGGVSINENELANASVFYANNQLNINGLSGVYSVNIIDLLGKSIYNNSVSNVKSINLNSVNNGIYLVQITKGNAVITKKVYIK